MIKCWKQQQHINECRGRSAGVPQTSLQTHPVALWKANGLESANNDKVSNTTAKTASSPQAALLHKPNSFYNLRSKLAFCSLTYKRLHACCTQLHTTAASAQRSCQLLYQHIIIIILSYLLSMLLCPTAMTNSSFLH